MSNFIDGKCRVNAFRMKCQRCKSIKDLDSNTIYINLFACVFSRSGPIFLTIVYLNLVLFKFAGAANCDYRKLLGDVVFF